MTNAFFHNFTTETFTGFWNGKPKTFKPGDRVLMPAWLAEHFAKHLTNRELIKSGKESYTSPKNPGQVPEFMGLFKKCYIPEGRAAAEGSNEVDEVIAQAQVPSMDIVVEKPAPIDQGPAAALAAETKDAEVPTAKGADPYDASAAPQYGPAGEPSVIAVPESDDEASFDLEKK